MFVGMSRTASSGSLEQIDFQHLILLRAGDLAAGVIIFPVGATFAAARLPSVADIASATP
jgi:hypothetical protein